MEKMSKFKMILVIYLVVTGLDFLLHCRANPPLIALVAALCLPVRLAVLVSKSVIGLWWDTLTQS